MVKKSKTVLQRLLSYGMTLIMTMGMCVGQQVPVMAEELTSTLVVASNFETRGNQVIWHNEEDWNDTQDEGPNWHEGRCDKIIGANRLYFGLKGSEEVVEKITKEQLLDLDIAYASEYTENEEGANTTSYVAIAKEDLSDYLFVDDVVEDDYKFEDDMMCLSFIKSGAYRFSNAQSSLDININHPRVGFYGAITARDEDYLFGNYEYSSEAAAATVYAVLNDTDNYTLKSVKRSDFIDGENVPVEEDPIFNITKSTTDNNVFSISFDPTQVNDEEWLDFEVKMENSRQEIETEYLFLHMRKFVQGLVIYEPDWDNALKQPESPEYRKSFDWGEAGNSYSFYIGIMDEEGNVSPVEDLDTLTMDDDGIMLRKPDFFNYPGLYDIVCKKTGNHSFSCEIGGKKSTVNATNVNLPLAGWYTQPVIAEEYLLHGEAPHGRVDGDDTIYLIVQDSQEWVLDASNQPYLVIDGNGAASSLSDSAIAEIKEYEQEVPDTQKVYEVSLKNRMACRISQMLEFNRFEYDEETDSMQQTGAESRDYNIYIYYDGEDAIDTYDGDIIRYTGEDGTDWVGFSGVFISKESYETGQTWFKGRFKDGICYYVHARTIQGVVDKLLAAAGTEVQVWDDKEKEDVTITLPNTGYIELNMSYRDSSYKNTVESEQYVYAPASIKGILMNAAENPYMIKRVDLAGNPFYFDENGTGDDIKGYDDVLELTLTDSAYETGVGIAKTVDGATDEGDASTIHGIHVSADDFRESEYDATTLTKLKAMLEEAGGQWKPSEGMEESSEEEEPVVGYTGPYLIQKVVYDEEHDVWEKTDYFYLVSESDLILEEDAGIDRCPLMQMPHRWPSLHVNASTQVRVQGLWAEDANLYIGFYDGEDYVYTDAFDQRFTRADIGENQNVTFRLNGVRVYEPDLGRLGEEQDFTSDVNVHVVKAESDTNVADSYSQGEQKAEILVDEAAISDFVPMTEEEIESIIDGGSLAVDMSIAKAGTSSEETSAVTEISQEIKKEVASSNVDYINVDLDYKIKANNGNAYGSSKKITETNEPITISVPVSDALKNKKNYYVYRYHEGGVEKLEAQYDNETGTITFETDKFSVYAIATEASAPAASQTQTPSTVVTQTKEPSVGQTVIDTTTGANVVVTDTASKEVTYNAPANTTDKKVVIPTTVNVDGQTYTVTKVADNAFKGNKKLSAVTIPNSVTEIGANAFKGCTSLTQMTVPANVTKIGTNAFNGCKKLKTIKVKSTKLSGKTIAKNAFKGLAKTTVIKVPKKKLAAYKKLFKQKGFKGTVKA